MGRRTFNLLLLNDRSEQGADARGFRGSTIEEIAAAGTAKPNLLYCFRGKEEIYTTLLHRLLDAWLARLMELDADGDPVKELRRYIRRKIEMSRDFPRESRLFANEILQGAHGSYRC